VALDTPDEQASVIVAVIEDLIEPNAFPDETRTELERQTQADIVAPIEITIEENELIIPAGAVVREAQLEAFEALNALREPELNQVEDFVAPVILMILTTLFLSVYLFQYAPRILLNSKRLILLTFLLLLFIAVAKFMIPNSSFVHLYPIAALTMLVVTLIDVQVAFILSVFLALIAGYISTENPQEVFIYLVLSGWTGVLALGSSQRVSDLLRAGVYVGLVNIGVIFIFNAPLLSSDSTRLGILIAVGFLNGVILSPALALVGLLTVGSLAGITTSIQLLDLARPTHPLQRQLLLKAPGTYHHSLMVGNLGEQAAERIGADSLLVRVMAYYHDIGKTQRPYFFAENQPQGINVHEKLEPQISAQIIISHVLDGLELAKKYRLPPDIQAGIAQHHGSDLVKYFYYQAVKAAEEKSVNVDEDHFRYPGPKPQTKETGILMLADVSESTVRALKPGSAEEIDEIVEKMIADKVSSGQLDECDLTISDLHHIRKAFVDILQGVHHPRIKYPDQIKAEEQKMQEALTEEKTDQEKGTKAESLPPAVPVPPRLQPASAKSVRPTPLVRRE
jgi:putative nucleotidyltransferase with HDIG domain